MGEAYRRGHLLYQHHRYDMAAEEFRRELQAAPDSAYAMSMLALCLCNLSQHDASAAMARQAIATNPSLAFAHYTLSICILRKPWEKTFTAFKLTLHKRNDRRYYLRMLKRARIPALEAVRLNPDDSDYLANLGAIELDRGKIDVAMAITERSLTRNPNHERSANLRSLCLRRLGRHDEAKQTLDRSLRINPENAQTHFNQGWVQLYAGNGQAAMDHFNEALRLNPSDKRALRGRQKARWLLNPIVRPFQRLNLAANRWLGPAALWRMAVVAWIAQDAIRENNQAGWIMIGIVVVVLMLFSPLNVILHRRRLSRRAANPDKVIKKLLKSPAKSRWRILLWKRR